MKIAQIAPIWHKIPPKKYGGAELVVSNLTEELVKRGQEVTLFAPKNSETSANLISVTEQPTSELNLGYGKAIYEVYNTAKAFLNSQKFDIIHDHISAHYFGMFFAPLVKTPVVYTMHNQIYPFLTKDFSNQNYISISDSLRKQNQDLNYVATVYNGIAIEKFSYNETPQDYFVWLGRFADEKGPKEAILAAKKSGKKLILAAPIHTGTEEFFEKEIKPHIDGDQIKYIGEVGHNEKVQLLKNARAILVPIKWEEPFGLVMPEALACGTPVIAFNRGAAPEIVENNKSGFIVKNLNEMISSMKNIDKINRSQCFERSKLFSIQKMTDGYEETYKRIIGDSQ